MRLEEYKLYLAHRIGSEVFPLLLPRPRGGVPPPHPLPPPLSAELKRSTTRDEAKKRVIEALTFILQNKQRVEEDLEKRLEPPLLMIGEEEVPEDLEDLYIEHLKRWAEEKRRELEELQAASEHSYTREKEVPAPVYEDPFREGLRARAQRKIGPLAFILPLDVIRLLEEHDLYGDALVGEVLRKLDEELRKPPTFADPFRFVERIPDWYLRALHESYLKKYRHRM